MPSAIAVVKKAPSANSRTKSRTVILKPLVQVLISVLGCPNWDSSPRADVNQATKALLRFDQIAPIGWECWPDEPPTLYFRLSLIWLVILAGGVAFLWFG